MSAGATHEPHAPSSATPTRPLRIACLASGGGTTVMNLADRIQRGELPAEIVLVAATRPGVPALSKAAARGIPTAEVLPSGASGDTGASRPARADGARFDHELADRLDAALRAARPDLICLCGYLRLFRVGEWAGRVINIHPGPLPRFGGKGMYGIRVHRAVLDAGLRETACCVHLVDDEYDHGPVLASRGVPIRLDDTAASLDERVRDAERELLPETLRRIATGALTLPGARLS
ncbi:MAG: phosphoribosylglycinamide formyltransferase [Phycisphaerae bacterium]|nr:phosphoribosylglycinamide formyltransferase [Phycisphaerae bacterium]